MANRGTKKADNVKDYISWAVEHNVGVIDVNIPKHISEADVSGTHTITLHSNRVNNS